MTAAAAVLLVEGVLGILYLPNLIGGDLRSSLGVGILVTGIAALNLVASIGLLRRRAWARLAAGAVAALSLVFMYAPALVVAAAHGVWLGFDWPGIVGYLVVLFAVMRRWPPKPRSIEA